MSKLDDFMKRIDVSIKESEEFEKTGKTKEEVIELKFTMTGQDAIHFRDLMHFCETSDNPKWKPGSKDLNEAIFSLGIERGLAFVAEASAKMLLKKAVNELGGDAPKEMKDIHSLPESLKNLINDADEISVVKITGKQNNKMDILNRIIKGGKSDTNRLPD